MPEEKINALMSTFFIAWLICGCSIDHMLDDWRTGVICIAALIAAACCAVILGSNEEQKGETDD